MSAPDNTPEWLEGVAAVLALIVGAFTTYLHRVFVTNARLERILEKQEESREEKRQALHNENLENFRTIFKKLGEVAEAQARTEGMLSGRYPRIER